MQIRVAVPADRAALANTLAEAFGDETRVFSALLRHALPHGQVYTTADLRAVTMWSPPGGWKLPTSALIRAAPQMALAAGARLPRLLGRLGAIEKLHGQQPPHHWYLEFVGAATGARGGGAGSALLAQALRRFDRDGVPTYLESSNPRNLAFYQRHGFVVTGEHEFAGGPPQWTLWRDADGSQSAR
jgi:ribosomal protein S18 acetylase RimI-like enzyme